MYIVLDLQSSTKIDDFKKQQVFYVLIAFNFF